MKKKIKSSNEKFTKLEKKILDDEGSNYAS